MMSLIASVASIFVLLFVCLCIVFLSYLPYLYWWMSHETLDSINIWFFAYALLPLLFGFVLAVPLARLALRIWPIGASKQVRWKALLPSVIILFFCCLPLILVVPDLLRIYFYLRAPFSFHVRDTATLVVAPALAAFTIIIGGASVLFFCVHVRPQYYINRPFVLFLRRFSTFADRTVVAAILKAAPRGTPVVFIASPRNRAANWDPFVWAFAGLRIRHVLKNLPVQLASSDQNWRDDISKLIEQSSCIIMDYSVRSPSIEDEISMIRYEGKQDKVILLVEESKSPIALPSDLHACCIQYKRSLFKALFTVFAKSIVIFFAAIFIINTMGDPREIDNAGLSFRFILVYIPLFVVTSLFVFRRSVSSRTRKQIKTAITAALTQ